MLELNRSLYEEFCAKNSTKIPFFCQPWWLDAVSGSNSWLPHVIYDNSNKIIGVCPLLQKSKLGIKYLTLPSFSAKTGIYCLENETLPSDFPKTLTQQLNSSFYLLTRDFTHQVSEKQWLDAGFSLSPYCIYSINGQTNYEDLSITFRKDTKQLINKGRKTCTIEINKNREAYLGFYKKHSYEKPKDKQAKLQDLDIVLKNTLNLGIGSLYFAKNKNSNEIAAAALFLEDETRTYYVSAVMDKNQSRSGASRILMATAIEKSLKEGRIFDFCGGNIPSIGAYFASFGAKKEHFWRIRYDRFQFIQKLI